MAKGGDANNGLHRRPTATPYRVSTITAVGNVGAHINLPRFFAEVPINDTDVGDEGGTTCCYVYAELAMEWRGVQMPAAKAAAAIETVKETVKAKLGRSKKKI